jgi:hypothetical protein
MDTAIADRAYTIRVHLVRHAESGLTVALSRDLRGLMVSGADERQIWQRVPGSIKELLEAQGQVVAAVSAAPEDEGLPDGFTSASYLAQVRMEATG